MTLADTFNAFEALFWITMGCGFLVAARRRARRAALTGLFLVAFGCSDIVELRTGAWWRPWWLLLWKTVCVVALASLTTAYYQRQRQATPK